MTNLFSQISELTPNLHGWATVEKAITLASAVIALRPEIVLEVGIWGGRSILPMGLACKELGRGKVIGVDPWSAVASIQGQVPANAQWWGSQAQHDQVYFDFMEKRGTLGLNDVIAVERMTSDYFEPPKTINLVHIDGNHGPQAIKDAQKFGPLIPVGGLMILDDLQWEGGNVLKAMDCLRLMGFVELYPLETGVVLQRISR